MDVIREVRSEASEGRASISAELVPGTDRNRGLQEIAAAVQRISLFPDDAEPPVISLDGGRRRGVMYLSLYGDLDQRGLVAYARQIEEALLAEPDIALVEIRGMRRPEVQIEITQARLRSLGLRLEDVARAIDASALDVPAGSIKTPGGNVLLKTAERRNLAREFQDIAVLSRADGTKIRLGDVAEVRVDFAFRPSIETPFVQAEIEMPSGTPVSRTREVVFQVERAARRALERNRETNILVGISCGVAERSASEGEVSVRLVEQSERQITAARFASLWREEIGDIPDVEALFFDYLIGPGGSAEIDIQLSHPEVDVLRQAATEVAAGIEGYPGVEDVRKGFGSEMPQFNFEIKPAGRSLGIDARELGSQIRHAFYGAEALRQPRDRDELRVMVRLPREERDSLSALEDLLMIPWSLAGAVMGHVVMGYDLSVFSIFGMLALCGMVVNGAFVMAVTRNEYQQAGMPALEAISRAAQRRFRPILLTALTTFLGLAPMILETSLQALFLVPMAIALGIGTMVSCLVVMTFIPAMMVVAEDLSLEQLTPAAQAAQTEAGLGTEAG